MTKKIAISVPDDVAEYLAAQPNTSAAVASAVRARMTPTRFEEMLRAAGFTVTDEGKAYWQERINTPMTDKARHGRDALRQRYGVTSDAA